MPAARHEDVAARPLGEVAVLVEQDRPGLGMPGLDLLVGEDEVQVVVRLGPRALHGGRSPADGWDEHVDAVAEQPGARPEGQGRAVHDHLGSRVLPALVADGINAAADALSHPPVAGRPAQRLVALHHLLRDRDHLLGVEAGIDPAIGQRAIEALHVLGEPEDAPVERARHVEAAISAVEAPIPVGDDHLALRDEAAVEPGDAASVFAHGLLRAVDSLAPRAVRLAHFAGPRTRSRALRTGASRARALTRSDLAIPFVPTSRHRVTDAMWATPHHELDEERSATCPL